MEENDILLFFKNLIDDTTEFNIIKLISQDLREDQIVDELLKKELLSDD